MKPFLFALVVAVIFVAALFSVESPGPPGSPQDSILTPNQTPVELPQDTGNSPLDYILGGVSVVVAGLFGRFLHLNLTTRQVQSGLWFLVRLCRRVEKFPDCRNGPQKAATVSKLFAEALENPGEPTVTRGVQKALVRTYGSMDNAIEAALVVGRVIKK